MSTRQHFTTEQARKFGDKFGVDWDWSRSSIEQFSMGLDIELEYGLHATPKISTGNASNLTDKSCSLNATNRNCCADPA